MGSEDGGPQPPIPSIGIKHASVVQDDTDPVEQRIPVLTTPAASSATFINNPYQLLMYDDEEEEVVEEEKELVEIPHGALSVGQHVSFAPTDIRSERVTKRVKHAPRASVPPKRILHLWKDIARVFDTQKKVPWKSALDSLNEAHRYQSSEAAKYFVENYMKHILGIFLNQVPSKLGLIEKNCVEDSFKIALLIIFEDLTDKVDPKAGECVLLEALSSIFNRRRKYYKTTKAVAGDMLGLPKVRDQLIAKFTSLQGFKVLGDYLSARLGSTEYPSFEIIHILLHAAADSMRLLHTSSVDTEIQRSLDDGLILFGCTVMDYMYDCSEEALKKLQPHDILSAIIYEIQRIYEHFAFTRRDVFHSFFDFSFKFSLKLITSQSLPLRLCGWETVTDLVDLSLEYRPPPRAFRVSGAGNDKVNGIYVYASQRTENGYVKPGTNLKYELRLPEMVSRADGTVKQRTLTLFRCTMRSKQKWWFLSKADDVQPGTDKDVDYYQHKSKKHEESVPPIRGWLTCKSNGNRGIDPPPNLEPIGLMTASGEEFNSLEHQLVRWAVENNIVEIMLGDSVHQEIVAKSVYFIRFLASMCSRDGIMGKNSASDPRLNASCLRPSHLEPAWRLCTNVLDEPTCFLLDMSPSLGTLGILPLDLRLSIYRFMEQKPAENGKLPYGFVGASMVADIEALKALTNHVECFYKSEEESRKVQGILIRWYINKSLNAEVCANLARMGHLQGLRWVWSWIRNFSLRVSTCKAAAEGGHLHILRWLLGQDCFLNWEIFGAAAFGGHVELMKWLKKQNCPWNESVFTEAAKGGHVEAIRWLYRVRCPWNEDACWAAAKGSHFDALRWLRQAHCPWNERTTLAAARNGSVSMMKWLREQGCPWNSSCYSEALAGGHIEMLEWLSDAGCPINLELVSNDLDEAGSEDCFHWFFERYESISARKRYLCLAVFKGTLEVKDFNWNDSMFGYMAVRTNNTKLLQWLAKKRCPLDSNLCFLAILSGHFDMLKLLHESGCSIDRRIIHPISHRGDVHMLQWMRSVGIALDEEVSLAVTHSGHLEALRWLKKEGCPMVLSKCLGIACAQGHIDIIHWLRNQGINHSSQTDQIGHCEACLINCGLEIFSQMVKGQKIHNFYTAWISLAREGDLKTLTWAKSEGFLTFDGVDDCGCALLNAAIHGGNLPVVRWFLDNNYAFCGHSASFAADEGRLMLLKELHKSKCPMDHQSAILDAARNGYLSTVKFLCDMDCPWNMKTYKETVEEGYHQTAQWLVDTRGFPSPFDDEDSDDDGGGDEVDSDDGDY